MSHAMQDIINFNEPTPLPVRALKLRSSVCSAGRPSAHDAMIGPVHTPADNDIWQRLNLSSCGIGICLDVMERSQHDTWTHSYATLAS